MPNPLLKIVERFPLAGKAGDIGARLMRGAVGLAQDYWRDGSGEMPEPAAVEVGAAAVEEMAASAVEADSEAPKDAGWHAKAGEISEKMWGAGYVTPGDVILTEAMIAPLGINKNMSMLDLSAGLGGRLRKTALVFGVYISGLEPDAEIAARGMQMSVAAGQGKKAEILPYDSANFKVARHYDCVLARETIYRVADKEKFIKDIAACCKPKAQVSFTDYVVEPALLDAPAITAWRAFETGASPLSIAQMAELWGKSGFTMQTQEDQSDFYRKEVMAGMLRLANFIKASPKPDAETKKAINKRIATWAHRVAAMEAGMKFYRFYGSR